MRNRRRFTITVGAVLMVCMLATGYAAVAAEYGSADDPLITQSYLEQVLTPSLTTAAEDAAKTQAGTYQSAMERKIVEMSQALDNKIASLAAKLAKDDTFAQKVADAGGAGEADAWESVNVAPGSTLTLDVDTEIVLRKGSATCVESAGTGLTDLSGGGVLSADESLVQDHRYIATTQNAGFHASSSVTVLINGGHSVS